MGDELVEFYYAQYMHTGISAITEVSTELLNDPRMNYELLQRLANRMQMRTPRKP